ncbi:MAG: hypothetical protein OJF49_001113 [Ktedonobacterales bacterium]|jgi:hypothetical protein|nr:MAG: hypothetical protein OJF49_001113 [Ktedonobacterales bacterium]
MPVPSQQTLTVYLIGVALIVWIIVRQLRDRQMKPAALWIMPVVMLVLSYASLAQDLLAGGGTLLALLLGLLAGGVLGLARGAAMRLHLDTATGQVILKASVFNLVFWLVAFVAKILAHLLTAGAPNVVAGPLTAALLTLSLGMILATRACLYWKYLRSTGAAFPLR